METNSPTPPLQSDTGEKPELIPTGNPHHIYLDVFTRWPGADTPPPPSLSLHVSG